VSAPALFEHPRAREPDQQALVRRWRQCPERPVFALLPPVEEDAARERIKFPRLGDARAILFVMSPIVEHVRERAPRQHRRFQDPHMVAIGEDASPPTRPQALRNSPIDLFGRGDLERLHALRERPRILGLDDEMKVRALNAQVDDAEDVFVLRRAECRLADRLVDVTLP